MPFACVEKSSGRAYCGAEIPTSHCSFKSPEWAYLHYNPAKLANPSKDPGLWACANCIEAIRRTIEDDGGGDRSFGKLIDDNKTKL